jgi:uncharacterized membrane protein YeaQ/YmgE (transglycosylase-associated protein family)
MTLLHLIVLLVVGIVCGLIAERVVHSSLPFGWIGAAVAGFVGAWLMVDVLHVVSLPTLAIEGLPIVSAILGAIIVVFLFSLVAGRVGTGRGRSWGRAA